jgi:hypothetical protein
LGLHSVQLTFTNTNPRTQKARVISYSTDESAGRLEIGDWRVASPAIMISHSPSSSSPFGRNMLTSPTILHCFRSRGPSMGLDDEGRWEGRARRMKVSSKRDQYVSRAGCFSSVYWVSGRLDDQDEMQEGGTYYLGRDAICLTGQQTSTK